MHVTVIPDSARQAGPDPSGKNRADGCEKSAFGLLVDSLSRGLATRSLDRPG